MFWGFLTKTSYHMKMIQLPHDVSIEFWLRHNEELCDNNNQLNLFSNLNELIL